MFSSTGLALTVPTSVTRGTTKTSARTKNSSQRRSKQQQQQQQFVSGGIKLVLVFFYMCVCDACMYVCTVCMYVQCVCMYVQCVCVYACFQSIFPPQEGENVSVHSLCSHVSVMKYLCSFSPGMWVLKHHQSFLLLWRVCTVTRRPQRDQHPSTPPPTPTAPIPTQPVPDQAGASNWCEPWDLAVCARATALKRHPSTPLERLVRWIPSESESHCL